MSNIVPTVKIKTKNGPVDINLTDFDAKKHQLADTKEPLKPLDPKEQKMLFGSSIQPASWTLPDGKVLQLGTVVAEAHKRSGLSVDDWNKQPQDAIEKAIAEVVAEMVPSTPKAFKVAKNGKRGAAAKFVIVDESGKVVGESEYDTEEAAMAQIAVLLGEEAA